MYHKSLTELQTSPEKDIIDFINSFDTVLTDCDGVLWLENKAIENSPAVMNKFRELGKKIFFVTNNSTKYKEDFVAKAKNLGFVCDIDEMISTSFLAASYLKEQGVKKVYVVGTKGITQELDRVGISHIGLGPDVLTEGLGEYVKNFQVDPEVGGVVVGFDEHISYLKLLKAGSYLANPKCIFVATNTDESFPVNNGLIIPGTGTIVSAIATCSNRKPMVLGKPNPYIVKAIMQKSKLNPERTLMIGDRCNTDILLGTNCGFQTLLVLTGVTKLKDATSYKSSKIKEENDLTPDVYLNKLGDLLPFLEKIQQGKLI